MRRDRRRRRRPRRTTDAGAELIAANAAACATVHRQQRLERYSGRRARRPSAGSAAPCRYAAPCAIGGGDGVGGCSACPRAQSKRAWAAHRSPQSEPAHGVLAADGSRCPGQAALSNAPSSAAGGLAPALRFIAEPLKILLECQAALRSGSAARGSDLRKRTAPQRHKPHRGTGLHSLRYRVIAPWLIGGRGGRFAPAVRESSPPSLRSGVSWYLPPKGMQNAWLRRWWRRTAPQVPSGKQTFQVARALRSNASRTVRFFAKSGFSVSRRARPAREPAASASGSRRWYRGNAAG